jgi:uncharacterized protein
MFIEHYPKNILYNTLTGSLMWCNKEFTKAYLRLKETNLISDSLLREIIYDEKILNKLKDEIFVVPDHFDELSVIRQAQDIIQNKDLSTNVEFIVSYDCNLSCKYCYAIRKNSEMSPTVAEEAATFAINLAKERRSKTMMVQFIGGEPLLNKTAIDIISSKMLEFKDTHEIIMGTSLTTNGVLLEKSSLESIRKLGPIQVQITIDGPEEIHNRRRPLKGGNSFKEIITNIIECQNYIDELVIRINVDYENITHVSTLLNYLLKNNIEKISLTIIPTFSHTDKSSHYGCHCFSKDDLVSELRTVWAEALSLGFPPSWNPYPTFMSCGVVLPGSIAIDPYGDIYKCAAAYGDKSYSVGNISIGIDSSPGSMYDSYIKRDSKLLLSSECSQCTSFPICMGGCSFRAQRMTGSMFEPDCRFDKKDCLVDFIRFYSDWYEHIGNKNDGLETWWELFIAKLSQHTRKSFL